MTCIIDMRDLRYELMNMKGGYIFKVTFLATFLGVDLIYLFACPLSEAHMGSMH